MKSMPDFAPKLDRAEACRGAAVLLQALDVIGGPGNDADMAKIIVDDELALRELIRFALVKLASEDQQ